MRREGEKIMMEGLQISIPQRMILVRVLVLVSLALNILLSLPLWAGERYFPYSPLIGGITLPAPYDYAVVLVLLLILIAALFTPFKRALLFIALLVLAYLVVCDLSRVQFWVPVYAVILFVFVWYDGRVDDSSKFTSYFIVLQISVAAVYFFVGLHQFNPLFENEQLPQLLRPLQSSLSERQFTLLLRIGKGIPYVIVFIGIGLVVTALRYLAIALALCLHVILIIFLAPSAAHPDYALWFSNFTFLALLLFLFSGKTKQRYYSPTFLLQMPVFYIVIVVSVVMPLINVVSGKWPDCLSYTIMTGSEKRVTIATGSSTLRHLGLYEPNFYVKKDSTYILDYQLWCATELHAQCVSERLVFSNIYQHILQQSETAVLETTLQEQGDTITFVKR